MYGCPSRLSLLFPARIVLFATTMATGSQSRAVEDATKIELIEGFQRALDGSHRRLLDVAKADWERLFSGKEPSDACVSVRIHSDANTTEKRALPGSAFLPKRASLPEGKTCERLA